MLENFAAKRWVGCVGMPHRRACRDFQVFLECYRGAFVSGVSSLLGSVVGDGAKHNSTSVFFRSVVSEKMSNRSRNGSLDFENCCCKVRARDEKSRYFLCTTVREWIFYMLLRTERCTRSWVLDCGVTKRIEVVLFPCAGPTAFVTWARLRQGVRKPPRNAARSLAFENSRY